MSVIRNNSPSILKNFADTVLRNSGVVNLTSKKLIALIWKSSARNVTFHFVLLNLVGGL